MSGWAELKTDKLYETSHKSETNWSILLLNLTHIVFIYSILLYLNSIILPTLRLYYVERSGMGNKKCCPKPNANMFMCITQQVVMYKLQQWYLDFIW